jgi:hypothetical protein
MEAIDEIQQHAELLASGRLHLNLLVKVDAFSIQSRERRASSGIHQTVLGEGTWEKRQSAIDPIPIPSDRLRRGVLCQAVRAFQLPSEGGLAASDVVALEK